MKKSTENNGKVGEDKTLGMETKPAVCCALTKGICRTIAMGAVDAQ